MASWHATSPVWYEQPLRSPISRLHIERMISRAQVTQRCGNRHSWVWYAPWSFVKDNRIVSAMRRQRTSLWTNALSL